jgi:3-oxoadipate enol-lactonase
MKKTVVIFCLIVLSAANLSSQKLNNKNSLAIDSGYIHVDKGKLFYEMAGQGENIVLLHDGLVHREIWDEQFPILAKNYRVVRYDRRSYGKSSDPQAPYSHIDDLNQLFVQLKIDKAIIFGMSSGGRLAIDFTLKYPDKVSGLVLVGAVVSGYGYSSHMNTRGGRINTTAGLSDPQKLIKYLLKEDPYEIYSENIKAKEKVWKLLETNLHIAKEDGKLQKPADRPAVKFLPEIKVSTLVLVGEYDIPDVHAHSGAIQAGIPNAKREIIFKSGHLIPLEQPEAFNAAVLKFLRGTEFFNILNTQGVNAAVQYFHKKRGIDPDIIFFDEREVNLLAYSYLQKGEMNGAIELFKLNTIAYPKSYNVFDSLGEAYMNFGNNELAIENYEKSLKLNPQNTNAVEQLKKLRGK